MFEPEIVYNVREVTEQGLKSPFDKDIPLGLKKNVNCEVTRLKG